MKECPMCGYVPTPSNETLRKLYARHFPGLPIMEMVKRGWIVIREPLNLEEILRELMRFSDCKTVDEFKVKFGYEGDLTTIDSAKPTPKIKGLINDFVCLTVRRDKPTLF